VKVWLAKNLGKKKLVVQSIRLWNSFSGLETSPIFQFKASLNKDLERVLWGSALYL